MKNREIKGKIKLVIAGNFRQYEEWLWFHKQLKGYEVSHYISSIDKLYGYSNKDAEIVLIGTYWENPTYMDKALKEYIKESNKK